MRKEGFGVGATCDRLKTATVAEGNRSGDQACGVGGEVCAPFWLLFRYGKEQLLGELTSMALVDRLINRMRQMFMRRSLFEQQTGTGTQERFSIPISDVK